jgi:hypothetical protein
MDALMSIESEQAASTGEDKQMSQPGQPEEDIAATQQGTPHQSSPLQRLYRVGTLLTATSPGEYLLPCFLTLMEACWLNAALIGLAGLDFLQSSSALVPFWGPPLLLCSSLWLFRRAMLKEAQGQSQDSGERPPLAPPGLRPLFGLLAVLTPGLIWLHLYTSTGFFLNPAWLLAFANDLLALNNNFYQALALIALTIYCCWRGIKLAQTRVEPGFVFRRTWAGLLVLLAAILLRAGLAHSGRSADDVVLVLLIPIFLSLALFTHALARIAFIRREHPFGLEGSVTTQERATLSVIAGVGLALLVLTLLGSTLFTPTFFASLHPLWSFLGSAYDLLVRAFSQLVVWILTPVYWLVSWWSSHFSVGYPHLRPITGAIQPFRRLPPPGATSPGVLLATKILLPLLALLLPGLLVYLALRRRRRLRIALNLKGGDLHESVWSWQLFLSQLQAFWRGLLQRLFPRPPSPATQQAGSLPGDETPAVRTMREIYRALLQKAASHGHRRKRAETPHEFQERMHLHKPRSEPQLGLITEAYVLARYGGVVPAEAELQVARRHWQELEQTWETSGE